MRGPPNPLYLLLISLLTAEGLKVTMNVSSILVLRGENVTIPCEFSDFTPGKNINVYWTKSQDGNVQNGNNLVYSYIPGRPQAFRDGAYMEEREIQRGNAALHIPQVQFSDDGEYTCTVIVTPESKEGRSALQVSAVPSAALTPGDDITVELGSEKAVSCDVSNFYPREIDINWVRHEKDTSKCVVLERGTCIGDSVSNPDGTFSITSHLTLYPTMADDGHKYSCVVKHRSLHQALMRNFTLTVTERADNSGTVVTAVIVTLLGMLLLFSAALFYYQVLKKDPPRLSEITGNDPLIDMNRTILTCHIINFKPNVLEISACLQRRGQERKTIYTWKSRESVSSARAMMGDNAGGSSVVIAVEQQSLMNGDGGHTQRPLHLEMTPHITDHRSALLRCLPWQRLSTYSCKCSIHITPSVSEDDGAVFSIDVSHPALPAAVSQQRTLRVIGVAPMLLKMVSPLHMTHGEPMMVTCPINGFKPRTLQITWLKKDKDDRETEILTWNSTHGSDVKDDIHKVTENEHEDKSYSFLSALMVTPSVGEDGSKYICRTYHPATDHRAEEELVMDVTAVPVLDPIKQTPEKVYVGATMTLSCRIHSFYPPPVEVTWYTEDGQSLTSDLSDLHPDLSGLYHVTSTMTYPPTLKDLRKKFTCQVKHGRSGALRTATWTLEDVVSGPLVSDISCTPPSPACGDIVTLSCDVSELYPKDFVVSWYKGRNRIQSWMCRETIEEDPESGTFRGAVTLTFTADAGCQEEDFSMELIHCGKTIEKKFRLILQASRFPVLDDIISDPSNPEYGQSVTLHCKVTNCNPQDTEVKWLKGEKPLEKGQGIEKQIPEKDGSVSCSLQITATALDFGKAYTCCVRHGDMTQKKNHYLQLPEQAPKFSAISVRPERPVAGKEATFTVAISGFSPDIDVKWYKDFSPFPSDFFTTSDRRFGKGCLLSCSSSLRFTPQHSDHKASIRCEAAQSVNSKVYEKLYTLHLSGGTSDEPKDCPPASSPDPGRLKLPLKIRGIQCLTESPRVGDKVTLTCYVDGCDVDPSGVFWKKGMLPIDGEIQNRNLEDGSGSFFTVTFTAQETDRDCTITCEVTYNFQTQEEHFTLKLQ